MQEICYPLAARHTLHILAQSCWEVKLALRPAVLLWFAWSCAIRSGVVDPHCAETLGHRKAAGHPYNAGINLESVLNTLIQIIEINALPVPSDVSFQV